MQPASGKRRPRLPGGFWLKPRAWREELIGHMCPAFREILDYLVEHASFRDFRTHGRLVRRGSLLTSYAKIADALHWFIGYRQVSYSSTQIKNALKFLRREGLITIAKTTRLMHITICDYELHQNPRSYEHYDEDYAERQNEAEPQPHDRRRTESHRNQNGRLATHTGNRSGKTAERYLGEPGLPRMYRG